MIELKGKLKGKKVIVTGGAGFIGSHVVDRCAEEEMEVYSVDVKDQTYVNLKTCYIQADIINLTAMHEVFNFVKPDFVVHCAAIARIQPSFQRPYDYFETNVIGTKNILKLSKEFGVKRLVFSSSSSVYGLQKSLPLTEDLKVNPINPYAHTKLMGENLCQFLGKMINGPETVCLRYFNVYGPRQPSKAGDPYATIIGIFLDQKKCQTPFTVVPDGTQRRDFTHVYDVAEANIKAMISPLVGQGEIINIGFGINHSIFDVIVMLGKNKNNLNKGKDFVFISPRLGEVHSTLASITKARYLLDWNPRINLSAGIKMC